MGETRLNIISISIYCLVAGNNVEFVGAVSRGGYSKEEVAGGLSREILMKLQIILAEYGLNTVY